IVSLKELSHYESEMLDLHLLGQQTSSPNSTSLDNPRVPPQLEEEEDTLLLLMSPFISPIELELLQGTNMTPVH
ncbi:hypothetical protein ADUPG1_004208, partial [Aduncisulcus paluster]